jgi:hypothetical protein
MEEIYDMIEGSGADSQHIAEFLSMARDYFDQQESE